MHIAAIDQFQQMGKDVMTPDVNSAHDHTNVALELRKTLSVNDGSSEITFTRIAKTKGT